MGKGFSGGVKRIDKESDLPTFKFPGDPNTRYDYYRNDNIHRMRWTDANGLPIHDRDFEHSGDANGFGFPHDHTWDGKDRGDHEALSDLWW